jgi:hypothetical protein
MILKLIYLALFLSIDVLLYLKLGRKIAKAGKWLIASAVAWLIVLIVHLPTFHLMHLMPLKSFLTFSGMVVQLIFVYYVGRFIIGRVESSHVSDDIKQYMNRILSFSFNSAIFGFYFVVHLIFILAWQG